MLRQLPYLCRQLLGASNTPFLRSSTPLLAQRRWNNNVASTSPAASAKESAVEGPVIYRAPLARPFRQLKLFSLTSLGLSTALSPLMMIIPAPLPTSARISLAACAVGASGLSTALIAWASRSFVNLIRRKGEKGMELESSDWLLRTIRTTVDDTSLLKAAGGRPFATWELAEEVYPPEGKEVEEGGREVLARTVDWKGRVKGEWVVEWKKDESGKLVGKCTGTGRIIRYFNVADELIDQS